MGMHKTVTNTKDIFFSSFSCKTYKYVRVILSIGVRVRGMQRDLFVVHFSDASYEHLVEPIMFRSLGASCLRPWGGTIHSVSSRYNRWSVLDMPPILQPDENIDGTCGKHSRHARGGKKKGKRQPVRVVFPLIRRPSRQGIFPPENHPSTISLIDSVLRWQPRAVGRPSRIGMLGCND